MKITLLCVSYMCNFEVHALHENQSTPKHFFSGKTRFEQICWKINLFEKKMIGMLDIDKTMEKQNLCTFKSKEVLWRWFLVLQINFILIFNLISSVVVYIVFMNDRDWKGTITQSLIDIFVNLMRFIFFYLSRKSC